MKIPSTSKYEKYHNSGNVNTRKKKNGNNQEERKNIVIKCRNFISALARLFQ